MSYGFGYTYSKITPRLLDFNPLSIDGLQLYLNKDLGVNTKLAADFDGVNQYLSSGSADFDKGNESFSFGCWVKFDTVGAISAIIGKWGNATNTRSFSLYSQATTNELRFSISTAGTTADFVADSGVFASTSTWYFVCGVYDSVNDLQKISVNGGSFSTVSNTLGAYNSASDLYFGTFESGGLLDGQQDGAFFYDKALSLAEIQGLYNSGAGLPYDSLPTLEGTQYAIGQSFNGTTDAFNIDSVLTPLASTTTGEIELYYTPTTGVTVEIIIGFGDAVASNTYIALANINGFFRANCFSGGLTQSQTLADSITFADGVTYKLNAIQNGTNLTLYVNDVEIAQTRTGVNEMAWFNDIPTIDTGRIACMDYNNGGNQFFVNGSIQNVKIYSDATQTNLVAHYPLNNVEGANQIDIVGGYDATPIGLPISTLADVDNTTLPNMETSLVSWWELNETTGTRFDAHGTNNLTDNNSVGYALGKIQEPTETGELVSQWLDQSSNMYVLSQDTITKMPVLSANSIDFDGLDDDLNLSVSDVFVADSSGVIFFNGVFDNTSLNRVLGSGSLSDNSILFQIGILTTGEIAVVVKESAVGTLDILKSTDTITNGAFYYGWIKSNGSTYTMSLNGVSQTVVVDTGSNRGLWFSDIVGRDNLTVGALLRVIDAFSNLKQNKIIYSNAALTDSEIAQIDNFMSNP